MGWPVSQKTCQQYIMKPPSEGRSVHHQPFIGLVVQLFVVKLFLHINCTNMKKATYLLMLAITALITSSCEKEKEETAGPLPANLHGVFIINEGAFGQGNASVSFASSDSSYYNADLFNAANGYPAGDLLQSMTIYHSVGYLCVNNSQRVEVVSMTDFKKK